MNPAKAPKMWRTCERCLVSWHSSSGESCWLCAGRGAEIAYQQMSTCMYYRPPAPELNLPTDGVFGPVVA